MEKVSWAEDSVGFVLPETVEVPPCGNVLPDGMELNIHRNIDDQPDGRMYAVYAGEANGLHVAISVAEFGDDEFEPTADIYPSFKDELEMFGLENKPGMEDGIKEDDQPYPFGLRTSTYASAGRPRDLPAAVGRAVAENAFSQAAARQAELIRLERERERGGPDRSPPKGIGRD